MSAGFHVHNNLEPTDQCDTCYHEDIYQSDNSGIKSLETERKNSSDPSQSWKNQ